MNSTTTVRFGALSRRFLATILDFLLFALISSLLGLVVGSIIALFGAPSGRSIRVSIIILAPIVALFYYAYLWHRTGATPARWWLKLRIVDLENPSQIGLPFGKALLRMFFGYWLNSVVEGLGFWWVFLTPMRQTWFDRLSKTVTLYIPEPGQVVPDIATIPKEEKETLAFGLLTALSTVVVLNQLAKMILAMFPKA